MVMPVMWRATRGLAALAACAAIFLATGAAAREAIATVVSLTQGAQLAGGAALAKGAALAEGDVIETDGSGKVEVTFIDDTRVAIGPRSRLKIEEVLMQSDRSATRLALNALGGSLRFKSGNSAKSAYAVTTPTATMGIRGTVFDVHVRGPDRTSVVLFSGEIDMCSAVGGCARIAGRCTYAEADRGRPVRGAESRDAKVAALKEGFPFIVDQQPLTRPMKARLETCGRDVLDEVRGIKGNRRSGRAGERDRPDRSDSDGSDGF